MAGSATIISNKPYGKWRTIVWYWTTDASGDVSGVGTLSIPGGSIHTIMSVPVSGVSDNFVLTLTGKILLDNGTLVSYADLLNGIGAAMSNSTNGESINNTIVAPIPYNVEIAPVIASGGNAQSGYLFLFVWEE